MKLVIEKCKTKNLPCLRDGCFEKAKWFIEGNPYCQKCKEEIMRDYGEKED